MWIDREADNSKANPQRTWQDEGYSSLNSAVAEGLSYSQILFYLYDTAMNYKHNAHYLLNLKLVRLASLFYF